jgi:signal transduction histidine kinase
MITVFDDILDFSKIEAGKLDLERCPFHLDLCICGQLAEVKGFKQRVRAGNSRADQ